MAVTSCKVVIILMVSIKIGDPNYERKITATCTAIHAAVEVINIQEKGR